MSMFWVVSTHSLLCAFVAAVGPIVDGAPAADILLIDPIVSLSAFSVS